MVTCCLSISHLIPLELLASSHLIWSSFVQSHLISYGFIWYFLMPVCFISSHPTGLFFLFPFISLHEMPCPPLFSSHRPLVVSCIFPHPTTVFLISNLFREVGSQAGLSQEVTAKPCLRQRLHQTNIEHKECCALEHALAIKYPKDGGEIVMNRAPFLVWNL